MTVEEGQLRCPAIQNKAHGSEIAERKTQIRARKPGRHLEASDIAMKDQIQKVLESPWRTAWGGRGLCWRSFTSNALCRGHGSWENQASSVLCPRSFPAMSEATVKGTATIQDRRSNTSRTAITWKDSRIAEYVAGSCRCEMECHQYRSSRTGPSTDRGKLGLLAQYGYCTASFPCSSCLVAYPKPPEHHKRNENQPWSRLDQALHDGGRRIQHLVYRVHHVPASSTTGHRISSCRQQCRTVFPGYVSTTSPTTGS